MHLCPIRQLAGSRGMPNISQYLVASLHLSAYGFITSKLFGRGWKKGCSPQSHWLITKADGDDRQTVTGAWIDMTASAATANKGLQIWHILSDSGRKLTRPSSHMHNLCLPVSHTVWFVPVENRHIRPLGASYKHAGKRVCKPSAWLAVPTKGRNIHLSL